MTRSSSRTRPTPSTSPRPGASEHLSFGPWPPFLPRRPPLARLWKHRIGFSVLLDRLSDIRLLDESDLRHLPSPNFRAPRSVEIAFRPSQVKALP